MKRYDVPKGPPDYIVTEIQARMRYACLPWWEQLREPPPPGWSGGWAARVVSRCAARFRKRAEEGPG